MENPIVCHAVEGLRSIGKSVSDFIQWTPFEYRQPPSEGSITSSDSYSSSSPSTPDRSPDIIVESDELDAQGETPLHSIVHLSMLEEDEPELSRDVTWPMPSLVNRFDCSITSPRSPSAYPFLPPSWSMRHCGMFVEWWNGLNLHIDHPVDLCGYAAVFGACHTPCSPTVEEILQIRGESTGNFPEEPFDDSESEYGGLLDPSKEPRPYAPYDGDEAQVMDMEDDFERFEPEVNTECPSVDPDIDSPTMWAPPLPPHAPPSLLGYAYGVVYEDQAIQYRLPSLSRSPSPAPSACTDTSETPSRKRGRSPSVSATTPPPSPALSVSSFESTGRKRRRMSLQRSRASSSSDGESEVEEVDELEGAPDDEYLPPRPTKPFPPRRNRRSTPEVSTPDSVLPDARVDPPPRSTESASPIESSSEEEHDDAWRETKRPVVDWRKVTGRKKCPLPLPAEALSPCATKRCRYCAWAFEPLGIDTPAFSRSGAELERHEGQCGFNPASDGGPACPVCRERMRGDAVIRHRAGKDVDPELWKLVDDGLCSKTRRAPADKQVYRDRVARCSPRKPSPVTRKAKKSPTRTTQKRRQ